MANNELFYRVAREALADTTISSLVDDLDAAVHSYLTGLGEDGGLTARPVREELKHGHAHAVEFADNLRAWQESAEVDPHEPGQDEAMDEAQQALIAAVWRLLDQSGGDIDSARDQFENAVGAWTP